MNNKILWIVGAALGFALWSVPVSAAIEPTSGRYVETVEDLRVKVLGGYVTWDREYRNREWQFVRRWTKLDFELDAGTGEVRRILRGADEYERLDEAGTVFRFGPTMTIEKTDSGYQWSDRQGNIISYNPDGYPISFSNRSGVKVHLTWTDGNLTGVADHHGNQVLWIEYQGDKPVTVRDATGRQVSYSYSNGLLSGVTDVRGELWQYGYNTTNDLNTLTDPLDRTTTIAYSGAGRVQSVTQPDETKTTYTFDYLSGTKEYYLRTTEPGGKITEAWYQRDGDIKRRDVNGVTLLTVVEERRKETHIDFADRRTTYEYDEFRNLVRTNYPDGSTVVTDRGTTFSNLTRRVDERGTITAHSYDSNGRRTRTVEAKGTPAERVTEYAYDQYGNRTRVTQVPDTDTAEAETRFSFDDQGNVTKIIDAEGGETTFTYDVMGNVLTRTDARGHAWTYAYDEAGNLASETDPLGHATAYEYDAVGNRIQETYADDTNTQFVYDEQARLVKKIDELGGEYIYEYDAAGNRTAEEDESGQRTAYAFDDFNRLASITDGLGNVTAFVYPDPTEENLQAGDFYRPVEIQYPTFTRVMAYDPRGRVVEQTDEFQAEGESRSQTDHMAYDPAGNRVATTDAKDRTTEYAFDPLNRMTASTDALGSVTSYAYDDRDNLLELTDANGHTHTFTYDGLNRMLTEARPMGETTHYGYDPAGNLVERIDAKGQVARFTFDGAGRRVKAEYFPDETTATPAKTVTFAYNARGSLTGYDDGTTEGEYTYDPLQRKVDEAVTYPVLETEDPDDTFVLDYQYGYYANGQKSSYMAIDGTTFDYAYNEIGELQAITLPGEGVISYSDFQWNKPTHVTYPGGTARQVTFDGLQRMQTIHTQNQASETLMQHDYQYDDVGNVLGRTTEPGEYVYDYDDLDRLTSASYPTLAAETFEYDSVGNRTRHSRTGDTVWQYNENNELLNSVENTWVYDDNGSTVEKRFADGALGHRYVYSLENRLSKIWVPDGAGGEALLAEYYYDPFGRRLWRRVEGEITYFTYTDEGYAAEMESATDSDPLIYHFSPDGLWSTNPVFRKQESTYHYYQTDHLGTPMTLISKLGATIHAREIKAFGQTVMSGTLVDELRLAGQMNDGITGLHYNLNRYYSMNIGRYLSRDPNYLSEILRHADEANYTYVGNNPIGRLDEVGLSRQSSLSGDPSGRIDAALTEALNKLKDCIDCKTSDYWKKKIDDVINKLQTATIRYDAGMPAGECAWTCRARNPKQWNGCEEYESEWPLILVGPDGLDGCNGCPLPSLIAHEGFHMTYVGRATNAEEDDAERLEKRCFQC